MRWSMVSKAALKSSETGRVESPWSMKLNIWSVIRRIEVSVVESLRLGGLIWVEMRTGGDVMLISR